MPPKKMSGQGKRRRAGANKGSPMNVPTLNANPKYSLTVRFVDETDDKLPYKGGVPYRNVVAAVARQLYSRDITPIVMTAEEIQSWTSKFFAVFHYLQINSGSAWGNPYVAADRASSTKFNFQMTPSNKAVRAPLPTKMDSSSGASERPFAKLRGGPNYFSDSNTGLLDSQAFYVSSADIVDLHVTVW